MASLFHPPVAGYRISFPGAGNGTRTYTRSLRLLCIREFVVLLNSSPDRKNATAFSLEEPEVHRIADLSNVP